MTATLEAKPRFRAKRGSLQPVEPADGGAVHPGFGSTTTPGGIAAHDPAADGTTTEARSAER